MTIIEKLAATIHDALDERKNGEVEHAFPFYYDTPETINLRMDNAVFPCAMLHVVESGTALNENGVLRERMVCEVVFAAPTSLDFDGMANERIIDGLKKLAFVWLQVLRQSSELQLMDDVQTSRYYATNDAILTGFSVTIRVVERQGVSPCDISL